MNLKPTPGRTDSNSFCRRTATPRPSRIPYLFSTGPPSLLLCSPSVLINFTDLCFQIALPSPPYEKRGLVGWSVFEKLYLGNLDFWGESGIDCCQRLSTNIPSAQAWRRSDAYRYGLMFCILPMCKHLFVPSRRLI